MKDMSKFNVSCSNTLLIKDADPGEENLRTQASNVVVVFFKYKQQRYK